MSTPERLRARAEEADRLAGIVSYTRDKERLTAQAAEMREQADALEAQGKDGPDGATAPSKRFPAWIERWLPERLRARG